MDSEVLALHLDDVPILNSLILHKFNFIFVFPFLFVLDTIGLESFGLYIFPVVSCALLSLPSPFRTALSSQTSL